MGNWRIRIDSCGCSGRLAVHDVALLALWALVPRRAAGVFSGYTSDSSLRDLVSSGESTLLSNTCTIPSPPPPHVVSTTGVCALSAQGFGTGCLQLWPHHAVNVRSVVRMMAWRVWASPSSKPNYRDAKGMCGSCSVRSVR
jgi:hypothetical protein